MDLAALAFSIDSSDTLKAVQALEALRQTTQATTQANQDFQTQGDFLVTSMASQGAGAARLSRQLGEIGDRFQDLMTQAEKARQAFDGSAASFDSWDIAQNKVEALGRAYGTTARGLDAYLQTANQLQMSSTQAAASVQRLTMALENQGAAAAAIRQTLTNNGVSINDLQTDQIDTLLTRIKTAFQNRPDSQQRTNDLRSVLGTFDPDVLGTFTNPNYVPINQVRDIQRRSATDLDVSRENAANRGLLRTQRENDEKLTDYRQTFGEAQIFGLPLGYTHRRPSDFVSSEDLARMRQAAPADSAFARDGVTSDAGQRAFYEQVLGTDISGDRSKFTPEQRIAAQVRDRQDATWMPGNTRNWSRYLDSGKVSANEIDIERRRNDELDDATSFWQRPAINLRSWGREVQNFFGGYTPTAPTAPQPTALDQEGTGDTLAGFGDNRIQRYQSALGVEKSLGVYQGNTGGDTLEAAVGKDGKGGRRGAALATFVGAYGKEDGEQNFRAAQARAVDTARRTYLDDGAVQDANVSLGLSTMSLGDSAQAKSFIAYARSRGVPASALAGQSFSDLMDPAKSAGGNLPAGMLDTFKKQYDINSQASSNEFTRGNDHAMGNLQEQAGVAGSGSANLQDLITFQNAYDQAMQRTNDTLKATKEANDAVAKSEAERSVRLQSTIGDLEAQNKALEKYNDTMDAEGSNGTPRAAGADRMAIGMTADIQTQVDAMRRANPGSFDATKEAAFTAAKQTELGDQAVKSSQDKVALATQELQTQQRLLSVAGDRVGMQDKMNRDIQVEMSFQKELAQAQASGDPGQVDKIQAAIAAMKRLKDAVAEVNLEAKAFKLGSDAERAIEESRQRMSLLPQDRGRFDAQRPVRDLQRESQSGPSGGSAPGEGGSMTRDAFMAMFAPEAVRIAPRLGDAPESILGHWGQETGWGAHLHDFNVGNIQGNGGYTGPTTIRGDKDENGNPYRTKFRTYSSPSAAADDYADLIMNNDRFRGARNAGSDALKFGQGLKDGSYMANPNAARDIANAARGLDLHSVPGSTTMPNAAQHETAIAGAAAATDRRFDQDAAAAIQETREQDARSQRAANAALPFVRKGDQVGETLARAGQVNDANPLGIEAAQADAQAKLAAQQRDYQRQLEATKAATDITIDSNKQMAAAYGTSTKAVQDLQDKLKVEAEARTIQMSDQDKLARLTQLATQRMTEQTAATEQQAKTMRDSTADQKAINDLGPFASEQEVGRRQTQLDIDKHNRDNPSQSPQAKQDYADAKNAEQAVRETTTSINEYRSAWQSAESASFSALNSVITTGGKATDVLSSLAKSLANIGLNTIEKSVGNKATDWLGSLFGGSTSSDAFQAADALFAHATGGIFVDGRRTRNFAVGGLIDRPTHFYSAGGETNLAGEMGTEAILPLKRMPNGDLGVSTGSGGSGGSGVTVHAPITIQGNGNGGAGSSAPDAQQLATMQMQLKEAVRQAVVAAIADEKRAGGSLY